MPGEHLPQGNAKNSKRRGYVVSSLRSLRSFAASFIVPPDFSPVAFDPWNPRNPWFNFLLAVALRAAPPSLLWQYLVWCCQNRVSAGSFVPQFNAAMPGVDLSFVQETVARIGRKPEALIPILRRSRSIMATCPRRPWSSLAQLTEIQPSAISGVSTFYDMFRHKPAGKHIVRVCHGTACHVAGAERVEDALRAASATFRRAPTRTRRGSSPSNRSPAWAAARSRRW